MKAILASVLALLVTTAGARAAAVPANHAKDSALLAALRQGGCVILMRDVDGEGLVDARAMGDALRQIRIPIGEVMSSPASRARETAAAAGLRAPQTFAQLGDARHSSSQKAVVGWSQRPRRMVSQPPPAGSNALLVTQMPNIGDAYGRPAAALKAGGALIFRPDGHGNMLAVMQIGHWKQLAEHFKR